MVGFGRAENGGKNSADFPNVLRETCKRGNAKVIAVSPIYSAIIQEEDVHVS